MRSKKFFKFALMVVLALGLTLPIFADPGVAKLNVWVSDVANACGTWKAGGWVTILDCEGILHWPCGHFLAPNGNWVPVPNGRYLNLPFSCGHLEAKLPPGYYWVVASVVMPPVQPHPTYLWFNQTTHVGIVQVRCGETACVKLFNSSVKLCWGWFRHGLRMLSIGRSKPPLDPEKVKNIEKLVDDLLRDIPTLPSEKNIEEVFEGLYEAEKQQQKKQ